MKQSKKVVARIIILILALFTVIPGTVSQKVYAEPGGSESNQAADASKDDSNKKEEKKEEDMTPEEREKKAEEDAYKMEIQSNGWKNWPKGPGTYGEAAIVMDAGTGSILYAKNIDEHEYPASITKVLTSLIALKYGNLSDKVTFSNDCISFMQPGDSSVGLKEGNVISLEQALYATLLASANEAAYAVAENVGKNAGQDYNWFIQQMNEECKSLGGNNSNFVNANGLHDDNHYTTAYDLYLIFNECIKHEDFVNIIQSEAYTAHYTDVDGMITDVPGLILATFYADCVPLYFIDPVHHAIGLSHSGWRGTVGRMGQHTIEVMRREFHSDPGEILAAVGPSICQDCYEVSEDVASAFAKEFSGHECEILIEKGGGKYQLDLWKSNEIVLRDAGILPEHLAVTNLCTCCNPNLLFSHRASHGKRGNLGAFLKLV